MSKDTKPVDAAAELAALKAEFASLQEKFLALAGAKAQEEKAKPKAVPGKVTYRLLKPRYSKGKLYAKGELITVEDAVPSKHWERVDSLQERLEEAVEKKAAKSSMRVSDSE